MRTAHAALWIVSLLVAGSPGGAARAQEPTEATDVRAREIFQNGARLYEEGLYEQAIVAFREALALSGRKELLLNVANAQERLGDYAGAIDTLNEYRIWAPADQAESLARRIRNLEKREAERVAAIRAEEPGPPAAVASPQPEPARPPTRDGKARRTAGWALFGSGTAVGLGFGAVATTTFVQSRAWLDDGDRDAWDQARPLNNASVGLAAAGGALAVTGLVVALTAPRDAGPVAVRFVPTGHGVALGGRF